MPSAPTFLSPFDAPALVARRGLSSLLTPDGELLDLTAEETRERLTQLPPPLLVHGPAALRALDLSPLSQPVPWFDLLDLFLFVRPATTVAPTPRGLALALGIEPPGTIGADLLPILCETLLDELRHKSETPEGTRLRALMVPLTRAGWAWSGEVTDILGTPRDTTGAHPYEAIRIWKRLPRWEETAPRPAPGSQPVSPNAARQRLREILGENAEIRPGQADFASVATAAFEPRESIGSPNVVLAEAGTGTGKTLGYIAPASLWAEQNDGAVWISTYTRHLQRQIEQELRRLYPGEKILREKVVVRKGRENYLCLLNMEDLLNVASSRGPDGYSTLLPMALLARWAEASRDGDLMGGDLPGWFGELFGHGTLFGIADRRGECIHAACPHYQTCFVEHGIRRARQADLVVANHALVLSQAAWAALAPPGLPDEDTTPTRYVFDEGHHIPDAADSAFATALSGLEAAELRRWLLGAEGSRSRARGLQRRLDDLLERLPMIDTPLHAALQAARSLPAPGWSTRLRPESPADEDPGLIPSPSTPALLIPEEPAPENPSEVFLRALDHQLRARQTKDSRDGYISAECDLHPVNDDVANASKTLSRALSRLRDPLKLLTDRLAAQVEDDAEMDAPTRQRIEAMIRTLHRRAISRLSGWIGMLDALQTPPEPDVTPTFVDFIRTERLPRTRATQGDHDIGLYRHWLDPTIPFVSTIQTPAHGLLMTSATLRDQTGHGDAQNEASWHAAELRLGATHFLKPPIRASVMSPFDYATQTRAYVISDVSGEIPSLAHAFRALFETAGGGALGLFTAIRRLREVHRRIHEPLETQGFPLYAQHVDAMDNATLVDVFRTETHSCLLGTDAMRDGVDVPGEALRMVVFEKTPWPRPDILHRERRRLLSEGHPGDYDDRITRMRLRQAFGRLIRQGSDRGVFVMLDRRMPSRLLSAFPDGVEVRRMPLAEALEDIARFLRPEEQENEPPLLQG
ncbi:ATP-dependent DNA helicase [Gluconobacter albidus]|uniref:DNA helicase n=1 Tax=Gluconobacter albidus TaxID=318683 RepID=A0AAW3QVW8_9PROT|nr:ATP-dependent DNA helicase [Gluconobacter albidus]KXV37469.1 DNA helicase [Gluconobacter albidus]GBQ92121.1 DNA helicase C2 [Gluconobacter albidus NBRC 3250]GLQ68236.1 DNA helicase [Gluconobacter albidus]